MEESEAGSGVRDVAGRGGPDDARAAWGDVRDLAAVCEKDADWF